MIGLYDCGLHASQSLQHRIGDHTSICGIPQAPIHTVNTVAHALLCIVRGEKRPDHKAAQFLLLSHGENLQRRFDPRNGPA